MKTILFFGFFTAASWSNATGQTHLFHGTWTRLGTAYVFEFDLHLEHSAGNTVAGYFKWKFVQYDANDPSSVSYYQDKIGATAKEFVRGTWNPASRTYHLIGYQKDDPDTIIALDEYLLKVDGNGDLGGDTRAKGSWLGHINAKALALLEL